MKVVILGYGKSGKSISQLLLYQGYDLFIVDKNRSIFESAIDEKSNITFFLEDDFLNDEGRLFEDVDFLVFSSGIRKDHPLCIKAREKNIKFFSEADYSFLFLQNRAVAITGTNGKTTTVKLIEHILNESGLKAIAVGNVGKSLSSYALEKLKRNEEKDFDDEILIVELSSFQIDSMEKRFFELGVVLNITPDHIIWHKTYENYILAKLNLKNNLKEGGLFFISRQMEDEYSQFLKEGYKIFNDEKSLDSDLAFFNENILAAYQVCCYFNLSKEKFLNSLKKFKKPEHRIELIEKINGIEFYNDSKSTNIFSTIYAINNLDGEIILIAGGEEKNLDFTIWKKEFINKVKYVFLIGKCAKRIEKELDFINCEIAETLNNAVNRAYLMAKNGDKILLSPGYSSFDQFNDYEHRGEIFKSLVRSIEKGGI